MNFADKHNMEKEAIIEKLRRLAPYCVSDARFEPAAVLMPIFKKEDKWHILLTLRSADLPTHKGQISFPGGRLDEGEDTQTAALRETHEELGIKPQDVELLGRLDDIVTITKYRITPFVGVIPYPYPFRVSEREIAEVIEIPLETFLDPKIYRKDASWSFEGKTYPVHYFSCGRHMVWGATARILIQFLEVVMDWKEP